MPVVAAVAAFLVLLVALSADSSWFETSSSGVSHKARRPASLNKASTKQQQKRARAGTSSSQNNNKDEVAMTEYRFEALNKTLQMKQNWCVGSRPPPLSFLTGFRLFT